MMKKVDFKPVTLPETNSSPLKMDGWLEYYFPFGMAYFQGRFVVSLREGIFIYVPQIRNWFFFDSDDSDGKNHVGIESAKEHTG